MIVIMRDTNGYLVGSPSPRVVGPESVSTEAESSSIIDTAQASDRVENPQIIPQERIEKLIIKGDG